MLLTCEGCTSASTSCNEDIFGFTDHAAWILDGATSLSRRTLVNAAGQTISDAAHFVSAFSSKFGEVVEKKEAIRLALEDSLDTVRRDGAIQRYLKEGVDVPSASFSAVTLRPRRIQVANLGDCTILLQIDGGAIVQIGSSAVRQLDAQLLSRYLELKAELEDREVVWSHLVPIIRQNRGKMNKPNGYWILEPQGLGLHGLEEIDIEFNKSVRGLLVTDGLYRIVDTYGLTSIEMFFEEAFGTSGLENLIAKTREAETLDPNASRWPRVKLADDATIIKFETK